MRRINIETNDEYHMGDTPTKEDLPVREGLVFCRYGDRKYKETDTSPSMSPDFLAVEQALNINVVKTTKNIFFKFLLNVIFSPGLIVEIFQIIKHYSSLNYIKNALTLIIMRTKMGLQHLF